MASPSCCAEPPARGRTGENRETAPPHAPQRARSGGTSTSGVRVSGMTHFRCVSLPAAQAQQVALATTCAPPVAMATRGAAPFPPSPAPARRARGAPGASPARGRPSAVTRPRGGLCRGALPGRASRGDTGAERGCGAGGGRRGPVRSGSGGTAPPRAARGPRAVSKEGKGAITGCWHSGPHCL